MVSLLKPRNEAEFVHELRSWFLGENKGRAYFQHTGGASGLPDFVFGMVSQDGKRRQFYAEAKYVTRLPRSMSMLFGLMRDIQKITCLKMAAAGFQIYLIVCVDGKEACWYRFDPEVARMALDGKCPKWQALYLRHVSRRDYKGRWVIGEPADQKK